MCTNKYHHPDALYCLSCLPAEAPLSALLIGARKPTNEKIAYGETLVNNAEKVLREHDYRS